MLLNLGVILLSAFGLGLVHAKEDKAFPDKQGVKCQKYVDDMLEKIKNGDRGIPADFELPDCDVFGDYKLVQCYGSWTGYGNCGCYKKRSGDRIREISGVYTRHPEASSMTCQCAYDQIYTKNDLDCDSTTGDFKPVRCKGNQCFCAERTGEPINGYNSFYSEDSNCLCARRENDHKKTGRVGLYFNCKKNGGYHPKQYRGSMQVCVDELGEPIGDPVPIGSDLEC